MNLWPIKSFFVANRIFIFLVLLAGCTSSKKFNRQEIIEQKTDAQGRIISKTYRQWISHPAHDKLATITQIYDTAGRVIKEYGFNNPYTYDNNYLLETIYNGNRVYISNEFVWNKTTLKDPSFIYNTNGIDSSIEMFRQNIFPDSTQMNKEITISLSAKGNSLYEGHFIESVPLTTTAVTGKMYSFEVRRENISFDSERKLILVNIVKK